MTKSGEQDHVESGSRSGDLMRGAAPVILVGIGLIHTAVGLIKGRPTIATMIRGGWWNSLDAAEASLLLWFLTSGYFLILFGLLGWWVERRLDRPLPQHLGWALLAFAFLGGTAGGNLWFPAPLFAGAGVIIVVRARRAAAKAVPSTPPN